LITTFTLPADDPALLARKIKRFESALAIKLKLEGNLDADAERVSVVRKARPDVWLSVDANQGFTGADLDGLARLAQDFSIELIEQPVRRGDELALEGWRPGVPVAADESVLHLGELESSGAMFDVINIKLDKCGGLTEALKLARVSRSLGKQVMVGNMGGSTLAMAPGFVLGQICDVIDLDGPFGLAEDPLAAKIYNEGEIFIPESFWGAA
jgi:L-alanine-DL-glutamate epimerase-like enolase superfamily enzyme